MPVLSDLHLLSLEYFFLTVGKGFIFYYHSMRIQKNAKFLMIFQFCKSKMFLIPVSTFSIQSQMWRALLIAILWHKGN